MSLLLPALVVIALLCAVGAIAAIIFLIGKQNRMIAELRHQTSSAEEGRASSALSAIEGVRSAIRERSQIDDETRNGVQSLLRLLSGSAGRGAAGENIVEQSLRHLPESMIERDFWINGKVVEFALRLPGGKKLAIDSKWTATPIMEALNAANLDPAEAARLTSQLEKEVERKVREVAQYLDRSTTTAFAIAAVPDSVYAICRKVFAVASTRNVIIISYSLTLPYILSLYQMYLQFGRTLDTGNLEAALLEIDRHLNSIDSSIENKLQRSITMAQNAYTETKQATSLIRAAASSIHVSPLGLESSPALDEVALLGPSEGAEALADQI